MRSDVYSGQLAQKWNVAKEYGPRGISANTVALGGIVTDFNNAAIRNNPQAPVSN